MNKRRRFEDKLGKMLFIVAVVASLIFLVYVSNVLALPEPSDENSKEEVYIKNGVVVIDGHLTKEERAEGRREYEARMSSIGKQRDEDTARAHQLECIREFAKVEALREEAAKAELQAVMAQVIPGTQVNAYGGNSEAYSYSESNAAINDGGGNGVVPGTTVNNTLVNVSENNNTVKSTNTNKQ